MNGMINNNNNNNNNNNIIFGLDPSWGLLANEIIKEAYMLEFVLSIVYSVSRKQQEPRPGREKELSQQTHRHYGDWTKC